MPPLFRPLGYLALAPKIFAILSRCYLTLRFGGLLFLHIRNRAVGQELFSLSFLSEVAAMNRAVLAVRLFGNHCTIALTCDER